MIQKIFIENFKAIYKAASFPLPFFTVFIGNNGTGKSSVMDALRILQLAINKDLNEAFKEWGGLNRIRNYNAYLSQETIDDTEINKKYEPITIALTALVNEKTYEYQVKINIGYYDNQDYYIVEHEELMCNGQPVFIANVLANKAQGKAIFFKPVATNQVEWVYNASRIWLGFYSPHISDELLEFSNYVKKWQFLYLNAHDMGQPVLRNRLYGAPRLDYTGRNIAEYLLWLKKEAPEYFDSLIRKMHFVLPYIKDIQSNVLEAFNSEIELLLYEASEKSQPLPGWLLSSGTLRILALLAMFETPERPSVLFIDEVENGLDPRTIGLLLSQIEDSFSDKSMQVVVTTHSPYFLDLVPLESIIVSEKADEGSTYHLPKDESSLSLWREKFSPGKLYTMGKLTK